MNDNLKRIARPSYQFLMRSLDTLTRPFRSYSAAPADKAEVRQYEIPMPEGFPFAHVSVKLTVPVTPGVFNTTFRLAHHVLDAKTNEATDRVIATTQGGYFVSNDLGETWTRVELPGYQNVRFVNAYQLSSGNICLQSSGPQANPALNDKDTGTFVMHTPQGVIRLGPVPGRGQWHGTSSIDEKDGVIMFADYQLNDEAGEFAAMASHVFRSTDGGHSWQTVLELPPGTVRHLHLLRADEIEPKTWWLTSGDSNSESRIWQSTDNGESWNDLTAAYEKKVPVGRRIMDRTVFRLTDLVFHDGGIIWGTDDIVGRIIHLNPALSLKKRSGARMFFAKRGETLVPKALGYCGQAVRNIVDCGKFWIVITQGRIYQHFTRPRVFLLEKERLRFVHLFDVDRHEDITTGFSYSIASRKAKNGVFFSYRSRSDVFMNKANILRWEIKTS